ncbi:MAG: hypothetical protein KGV44_12050 [Flavobacteriaceae bacterium]|nr:hypothetical protein [Flavobacteriaceae bacterium]
MKKLLTLTISVMLVASALGQKKNFKDFLNHFSGSFESNIKWYDTDKDELGTTEKVGDDKFRANSYLKLNYNFLKHFSANMQLESYEPMRILNYYPEYKKTNISTYSLSYKTDKIDLTAGYFYEQFGSGLLLRAFEERQLGLNNALRGGRIKYTPTDYLKLTALCGQNKVAFDVAKSLIWGFDNSIDFTQFLHSDKISNLSLGFSYVGKKEKYEDEETAPQHLEYPELIHSFAVRANLDFGNFYTNIEYSLKGNDIANSVHTNLGVPEIKELKGKQFKGNALLYTLGYTQKGLGITGTFRRLENMSFFAQREFNNPTFNKFKMLSINYIPTLTKQQDYSLANIYMYQSQPNLVIANFNGQAGEIGGQFDIYYNLKKGTFLGGKYGTKLAFNFSYWSLLNATFDQQKGTYSADFLKFGTRLNKDFNFEIRKKWSRNFTSIFCYINKSVNKGVVKGGTFSGGDIDSHIAIAEGTYKMKNRKSLRLELQHLWTKQDKKNWFGATAEFVINRNFAIYASDNYNYGNEESKGIDKHYYNVGGSFTKGTTRIALNYGKQRGGLLCVGGICRYVQPNKGVTLNLSMSF